MVGWLQWLLQCKQILAAHRFMAVQVTNTALPVHFIAQRKHFPTEITLAW